MPPSTDYGTGARVPFRATSGNEVRRLGSSDRFCLRASPFFLDAGTRWLFAVGDVITSDRYRSFAREGVLFFVFCQKLLQRGSVRTVVLCFVVGRPTGARPLLRIMDKIVWILKVDNETKKKMSQNDILACSFMVMSEPVILKGTVLRL